MSLDAQKQIRENTQELHDFLKDLQNWEKTVKTKDNQLKTQTKSQEKEIPPVRGKGKPGASGLSDKPVEPAPHAGKHTYDYFRDKWDKFDVDAALKEVDQEGHPPEKSEVAKTKDELPRGTPQTFATEYANGNKQSAQIDLNGDSLPDASSEKDLGNEYFKEKKYVRAIECYSRSIALQPTAVAFANRAMALLKIRRYEDAEMDCSEAIALDDRYTKAYARRGTGRKERNKLVEAVEDFEFALRLEPQNKELQKQYQEAKELYEKKNPFRPPRKRIPLVVKESEDGSLRHKGLQERHTETKDVQRSHIKVVDDQPKPSGSKISDSAHSSNEKMEVDKKVKIDSDKKQELVTSVQAAATRAAASAMTAVAQKLVAPKTSYEFETLWRGFADDRAAKARLIKLMDPVSVPKVFKESLNAGLMVDIIETVESFFPDDASMAIQILENLTKVGRFSMTAMFLTQKDKTALRRVWDKASASEQMSMEDLEKLEVLHGKYKL